MEIAIISDTHMPRRQRRLPEACVARLRAADLIVHAGDLVTLSVLHELQSLGEVVAVHGNVDDVDIRAALPEAALVQGGARRRSPCSTTPAPLTAALHGCESASRTQTAVIFGHSHMPLHESDGEGFQIFNPGSPTERRRAPRHTMGIARIADGAVSFELVAVD